MRPGKASRRSLNTTMRTISNTRSPTYVPVVGGGPVPCSCFAPGTKVWTLTGRQAIEKIKVGDRVLAQDVESGELAYKPVLAVTVRQPGPRMKIGLDKESITATPSHPFWVAGQGWRMTKQLAVGSRLHTLSGAAPVETIEKLPIDPSNEGLAYNLIVADFDSYFVGEAGSWFTTTRRACPRRRSCPGWARRRSARETWPGAKCQRTPGSRLAGTSAMASAVASFL